MNGEITVIDVGGTGSAGPAGRRRADCATAGNSPHRVSAGIPV
ncbi:hypothetical protein NKH77_38890 [Streptomyces sp. M19]